MGFMIIDQGVIILKCMVGLLKLQNHTFSHLASK